MDVGGLWIGTIAARNVLLMMGAAISVIVYLLGGMLSLFIRRHL